MSWLTPLFGLIALGSLPVVLLLHLLRRRRRRFRVPSLDLWHDPAPTIQRRPRQLPITLPLLLRLLIAALLALALGRPLLQGVGVLPTLTVLVLDTSSSMGATDVAPSRWTAAQAEARRYIQQLRSGDELALIALGTTPQLVARGGAADVGALETALRSLQPNGDDGSLQTALDLARALIVPERGARIVVLTDTAQHSTSDLSAPAPVAWRAFGTDANNVAFAAFAASRTRTGTQLYARVVNHGQNPVARTLTLRLNGQVATTEPVRLERGAHAEWSWPLPPGTLEAEATLNADDPLGADDRQAVLIQGNTPLRVLIVSPTPSPLERALRALPNVVVTAAQPQNYTTAATDLVVFSNYVPDELPPVPTWLVAPKQSALLPVSGVRSNLTVASVPDNRFASVDLRPLNFSSVAVIEPPTWSSVAVAAADTPLILTGAYNGQAVIVWTFDPDKAGMPNRLQFPLLTAATLRTLVPGARGSYAPGDAAPQALTAPDGTLVAAGAPLPTVGIYRVDDQPALTVNFVNSEESDLTPRPRPTIQVMATPVAAGQVPAGRELWRLALAVVCFGLLGEALWAQIARLRRRPQVQRA